MNDTQFVAAVVLDEEGQGVGVQKGLVVDLDNGEATVISIGLTEDELKRLVYTLAEGLL